LSLRHSAVVPSSPTPHSLHDALPIFGDSVRVEDPLGFPYEFFYDVDHVERLAWRYDLQIPGELVRLDHFNQVTPDVPRAAGVTRSEEHTSELQSRFDLVCRLLLEIKK